MTNKIGVQGDEKVDIIIDGFNLFTTTKSLGWDVDYKKLFDVFSDECILRRAHYMVAFSENDEYSPVVPLTDWLEYNHYNLTRKPVREYTDHSGSRQTRDTILVEMAIQMMQSALSGADHIVLFSGKSDMTAAVEAVQKLGPKVTVVSSLRSDVKISDDLRRQVDNFVEINDLQEQIGRQQRVHQEARSEPVVVERKRLVGVGGQR